MSDELPPQGAMTGTNQSSRWANFLSLTGWRIRMLSYWMRERHIPGHALLFHIGVTYF